MRFVEQLINQDLPNHVRCNHALEHATLHVLQEKGVGTAWAAYQMPAAALYTGKWILR